MCSGYDNADAILLSLGIGRKPAEGRRRVDIRAMLKQTLIQVLENALARQGLSDIKVLEISDDYLMAKVRHASGVTGLVEAAALLEVS